MQGFWLVVYFAEKQLKVDPDFPYFSSGFLYGNQLGHGLVSVCVDASTISANDYINLSINPN